MRIGMVGLGRMGANMAARLLAGGHEVVGFDPRDEARAEIEGAGAEGAVSLAALVERLAAPRCVWIMVPAGEAVEATLAELSPLLARGDVLVDGGNSNYRDTRRRAQALAQLGLHLVDAGTSGGIWGRSEGYCLMVGGQPEAVERLRPALETLAPGRDQGWGRVGPPGAGHFVKMIHNGIEYGMMQAYAEGFALLRAKEELGLDVARIAELWRHGSVVRSWLLDLTAQALEENEELEGLEPFVADSGEGRWTVFESIDLNVPAPVISLSLIERLSSREKDSYAHKLLAAMRQKFGGHAVRRKEGAP